VEDLPKAQDEADRKGRKRGKGEGTGRLRAEEQKLVTQVTTIVTHKDEDLLADVMGYGGIRTVKIDRGDTKVIVQQLSRLEGVKNDTEKLKRFVALKMDKADGERALSIRIAREKFFGKLTTVFLSN
jgi:hypothetical protein